MHTPLFTAAMIACLAGTALAQAPDSSAARPTRPRPTASAPT